MMPAFKTASPKPATAEQLADLWVRYAETRDWRLRERLVLEHAPLVKYVIDRMAIPLPPCLEYEDLISHGIVGLIQAVDRYDPSRGVPFRTYAIARIRGQVLDTLRRLDLVPRSARQRAREIERAIQALRRELGRTPSDEEVAAYLGIEVETVRTTLQQAACVLVSMDSLLLNSQEEGFLMGETLEDHETPTPMEHLEELDIRERLREALQELSEREQLVLSLYYEQELTMKEIGKVLGVTESRVSQIYSRAILNLRALMQEENA